MAQGYYTLDEAAKILRTTSDELKQMARKGQLRSFQDRGTWRFRVQDIDELARSRSVGSDPELPLAEPRSAGATPHVDTPRPRTTDSPSPRRGALRPASAEVFHFSEEDVGIGRDPLAKTGSKSGPKSGPKTPPRPPESDSEVRLVLEGPERKLDADADSDVKLTQERSPRPGSKPATGSTPKLGSKSSRVEVKKPSKADKPPVAPQEDSDIRLVPMDSDSDVKLVGTGDSDVGVGAPSAKTKTDSDIQLDVPSPVRPAADDSVHTEEIDLDEELRRAEAQKKPLPQSKIRPTKRAPDFPTTSPFELHEEADGSRETEPLKGKRPSDSDFDLESIGESSSPLDPSGSDEFRLELPDDEDIGVGKTDTSVSDLKGPSSGISLDNPLDSGISLEEESGSGDDFDLLTLDDESDQKRKSDSDSEFELTLDEEAEIKHPEDSDSEFELTLDDSSGEQQALAQGDEGIFDTDFDVPELEESGSDAVAVDDADASSSSDFDLALADDDISIDEESGSQVVAIDEEEVDDAAATVAARRKKKPAADIEIDEDFGDIAIDEGIADVEEDYEAEAGPVVVQKALQPAPWGVLPVACLVPSVIILFLVGVMGLEMLQSMGNGHKAPGVITRSIGRMLDSNAFKN